MVEALIIALIAAKLKGYRLAPLLRVWAIYPYLAVSAMALGFYTSSFFSYELSKYSFIIQYGYKVALISLWVYLIKTFTFKHMAVILPCLLAGTALNKIVMEANGGKMPYLHTMSKLFRDFDLTIAKDMYVPVSSSTRLPFLSDVIDTGYELYSLGDVLIFVVPGVLVYLLLRKVNLGIKKPGG